MRALVTVHVEWKRGSEQGGIDAFKAAITKGMEKFTPDPIKPVDFFLTSAILTGEVGSG